MPDKAVLRQYQALPLGAKVSMSYARIREWYDHFNGDVCVSFSGGKDSTVLAHLVRHYYPQVPLVFCNTGLEYPEIQAFARKMGAIFIRPKMSFSEVISTYGYPVISKEVAECINYARAIRNSMREAESGGVAQFRTLARKRDELFNRRQECFGAQLIDGGEHYGRESPPYIDGSSSSTETSRHTAREAESPG